LWRICKRRRASTAFDGEGAKLYPGRWNPKGVPVVYCASSLSLATLEYFVHVNPEEVPDDLVSIRAELPESVAIERVDRKALPRTWRDYPAPGKLKDIGGEWADSKRSVVLEVPSVVTPGEANLVINPIHPEFARLTPARPEAFAFDPRMFMAKSKAKAK
jgi:RES domain-containing protein